MSGCICNQIGRNALCASYISKKIQPWDCDAQARYGYDQKTASRSEATCTGIKNDEQKKCESILYDKGSGNVYADLGFKQPEIWTIKARIATQIFELIKEKGLTQKQAGVLFGIAQGRVSDLKRGQFDKFSIEKLLIFLNALDQDIEIRIHPKVAEAAQVYMHTGNVQPVSAGL